MLNRSTNLALVTIVFCSLLYVFRVLNRYSGHNVYVLIFDESTSGLMVGSPITMMGVRIGIVKQIVLVNQAASKVKVLIQTVPLTKPELLEARLSVANVMVGHRVVDLCRIHLGYVLPKIDGYTQIRVATSINKKILDTIDGLVNENNLANIEEAGKEYFARLGRLIANIESISTKISVFLDTYTTLADHVSDSVSTLQSTKRRVDNLLNNANQILTAHQLEEFLKTGLPAITNTFIDTGRLAKTANRTISHFGRDPLGFLFEPRKQIVVKVRKKAP